MADDKKTSEQTIKELEQIAVQAGITKEKIKEAMDALKGDDAVVGLEKTKELFGQILDSATEQGSLSESQIQNMDKLISKQKELVSQLEEEQKISNQERENYEKYLKKKEKGLDLVKDENYELEQQFKKLADIDTRSFGIVEKWKAYKKKMADLSPEEATRAVMNKIADAANAVFLKVVDASLEFDKVTSKVSKTLSTTKFAGAMEELRDDALYAGASVEELGESITTLGQNYTNFTRLDASTAKQLASTATALNAAGFSAAAFAKTLDIGVKTLGMSEQQVDRFSRELVNFGKAADIPLEKLSNDLASVGPQLANFGANAENTFKKLSLQAKSTGVELNRMFQITEQYTTFEGAANAAAKLNSVLGGNFINSLDLMNASLEDPAEAIRMMKDSMDASGKSFDDMPNSMKRVIAEAAGFSDVSEAARIFGMESDEASDALEEQAATQEELNKMSRSFLDVQEKLNKLLAQMTPIVMPIVKKLGEFVDVIAKFVQKNKEVTKAIGWVVMIGGLLAAAATGLAILFTWVSIVAKAFTGLKFVMTAVSGVSKFVSGAFNLLSLSFGKIGATAPVAAAGETAVAGATAAAGSSATAAVTPMLALAAAIFMIGAGVGIAAAGLALFVGSFSLLSPEQTDAATTALLLFGAAVVALFIGLAFLMTTGVAEAAIVALLGLGAAVLMIGVGIGVAAAGLAFFIYSIGLVSDKSLEMLTALTTLGIGILAFGLMIWPVIVPITAIGTGILAIGAAFILGAIAIKIAGDSIIKLITGLAEIGPITMLKFAASASILAVAAIPLAFALALLGLAIIPLASSLPTLGLGAVLLAAAFFIFAGAVKMLGDNMATFISSLDGFFGAAAELSGGLALIGIGVVALGLGLAVLGTLGQAAIPVLLALGGSILMAGIGFTLFAGAVKMLGDNMTTFISSLDGFFGAAAELAGGLALIGVGVAALGLGLAVLGTLGQAAIPVLLALGGSILMAGIGFNLFAGAVKMLGDNMATFISSLDGFFGTAAGMAGGLFLISLGIGALGYALATFGIVGAVGVLLLSSLIVSMTEGAQSIDALVKNVEKVPTAALAYKEIASAIEMIAEALEDIDEDKLEAIASVRGAKTGITGTPTSIKTTIPTMQVNEIVVRNNITQENTAGATNTATQAPPINIELSIPVKIDGNEFKNVIAKIAEEQISKNASNASSVNLRIK